MSQTPSENSNNATETADRAVKKTASIPLPELSFYILSPFLECMPLFNMIFLLC
jgi:hypothetical protein